MKVKAKQVTIGLGILVLIGSGIAFGNFLAGYRQPKTNIVRIDGSSTVYPITEAIAKKNNQTNNKDI